MSVKERYAPFPIKNAGKECQTYYKIVGDISQGTPLIVLHGGPGAAHNYLLGLTAIHGQYGIPLIFYDQLGCGQSTALKEKAGDTTFWTEELFHTELDNLIDTLKLHDTGFDILGHSWGGMLGSAYAARQPRGLRKLILANAPASMPKWVQGTYAKVKLLPQHMQDAINTGNAAQKYDSPEYMEATMAFAKRFMCWKEPFPSEEFMAAIGHIMGDTTVSGTMWRYRGPSQFVINGSLKTWSVEDRLAQITSPTLLLTGSEDPAEVHSVQPFFQNIPRVKRVTLDNVSHYAHVDAPERFVEAVWDFLSMK